MKKLTFLILGVQIFQENSRGNIAAIIVKPSQQLLKKDNTPVQSIELNAAQFQRIVNRTIGIFNPIGFKHIVESCNGSAKLTIDAVECKAGQPFTRADGSTDTYNKDWTKYSGHSVNLGAIGSMKLAEMSLNASFQLAATQYAETGVSRKVAAKEVVAETNEDGESNEEAGDKGETPTV